MFANIEKFSYNIMELAYLEDSYMKNGDKKSIALKAYAKINLALDVIGVLENGYHEVRMIMQSVDMYDKVNLYVNNSGKITVKTNLSFLPVGPDNLVYKAAALLFDEFDIKAGLAIDLYKYIPVAAGMAGGSTDAAAVLKGVNELFSLGLSMEELMERGARIGADIPYCIMGGTALAEGIGEKLTRISPCPDCYFVVGKPGISVSTKYVYDNLVLDENTKHPDVKGMIKAIEEKNIDLICSGLSNVLEDVTVKAHPVIHEIKHRMMEAGAGGALMSGSGPTVFGIFTERDKAEKCAEILREEGLTKNTYVTTPVNCAQ